MFMKAFSVFLVSVLVCGVASAVIIAGCSRKESGNAKASQAPPVQPCIRALSLHVLQEQLTAAGKKPAQTLLELGGMTTLLGYILDDENPDILLYGEVDPRTTNRLRTEDFVLALRNAWFRYAELRGNTRYYSYPGCTIDPNPKTISALNKIGDRLHSREHEQVQDVLQEWNQTCNNWQEVKVFGLPPSEFAALLVQCDYDMKRLVDGMDPLNLPGFLSLPDLKVNELKEALSQPGHTKTINFNLSGLNQFWFYPGDNRYEEDEGIIWIKHCPVVLLTQENFLNQTGDRVVADGSIDPFAQKFCDNFTRLYSAIGQLRPDYAKMEALFRFVALSQIFKYKDASQQLEAKLKYLLDDFPAKTVPVSDRLRGRSAVKEFNYDLGGGTSYHLWLPSCGGVGMDLKVAPTSFYRQGRFLKTLQTLLKRLRPPQRTLFWDIPLSDPALKPVLHGIRLSRVNSGNRVCTVLYLEYDGHTYSLYSDLGKIYDGNTVSGILEATAKTYQPGSPLLREEDIRDAKTLGVLFQKQATPFTRFIWSKLSLSAQSLLLELNRQTDSHALKRMLVDELNRVLNGELLYSQEHCQGLQLSDRTSEMLSKDPQNVTLINRLLLEDGFKGALEGGSDTRNRHFTFLANGIGPKDLTALRVELELQAAEKQPLISISVIEKSSVEARLQDAISTAGVRFIPDSLALGDTPGEATTTLTFVISREAKLLKYEVELTNGSAAETRALIDELLQPFRLHGCTSSSLLETVQRAKFIVRDKQKSKSPTIQIRFKGEGGVIQTGQIGNRRILGSAQYLGV